MDDITEGLVELDPVVRFDAEKVKIVKVTALVENEKEIEGNKKTIIELKKMVNTIYKSVQFTDNYPSNHELGKMPVLDLKMYADEAGVLG